MVLKFISRSLGKFLISFSLTFFILSFLAISLADNTDTLRSSLSSGLASEDLLEELIDTSELSIGEIKELCKQNPEQGGCDAVNNPAKLVDEQIISELDPLLQQIKDLRSTMVNVRILSVITFILGMILLYLGTFNIPLTLYKASLTTSISSAFYIIFYKFVGTSIPSIAEQATSTQEVPQELIQVAISAVTAWMEVPISAVVDISTILIVISLPLTILFFFLKRRHEKNNQPLTSETNIKATKKPSKK